MIKLVEVGDFKSGKSQRIKRGMAVKATPVARPLCSYRRGQLFERSVEFRQECFEETPSFSRYFGPFHGDLSFIVNAKIGDWWEKCFVRG
jgi:hypothetical protein